MLSCSLRVGTTTVSWGPGAITPLTSSDGTPIAAERRVRLAVDSSMAQPNLTLSLEGNCRYWNALEGNCRYWNARRPPAACWYSVIMDGRESNHSSQYDDGNFDICGESATVLLQGRLDED